MQSIQQLLHKSWELYKHHGGMLFRYIIIVFIPFGIVSLAAAFLGFNQYSLALGFASVGDIIMWGGWQLLASIVALVLAIPLIRFIASWYQGTPLPTIKDLVPDMKRYGMTALIATVMVSLFVMVVVFIIGVVISIIGSVILGQEIPNSALVTIIALLMSLVTVWFVFIHQAIVIDNKKSFAALEASAALFGGRWWQLFLRILIPTIIVFVVLVVLQQIQHQIVIVLTDAVFANFDQFNIAVGLMNLVISFIGVCFVPLVTSIITMLYIDLTKQS